MRPIGALLVAAVLGLAGCERGTEPTAPHTTAPETLAPAVVVDDADSSSRGGTMAPPANVDNEPIESPLADDPEGAEATLPVENQPEPTLPE